MGRIIDLTNRGAQIALHGRKGAKQFSRFILTFYRNGLAQVAPSDVLGNLDGLANRRNDAANHDPGQHTCNDKR